MNKKQKNRKSVSQNQRNRIVNRRYKSTSKTLGKLLFSKMKKYEVESEKEGLGEEIRKILNHFYSMIDKGIKKNVFHQNTGNRKKSKLGKLCAKIRNV